MQSALLREPLLSVHWLLRAAIIAIPAATRSTTKEDFSCDSVISRCRMHPRTARRRETLQEDREAIILADKLGFYDAFVGEHLTDQAENVTNSFSSSRR